MRNNKLIFKKDKKIFLIGEAADYLGVSIDTVRRWNKVGRLKAVRMDGKNRHFVLSDLEGLRKFRNLKIGELAKQLRVSVATLRRWETEGLIKPIRTDAGERTYTKEIIKGFIKSKYWLVRRRNKNGLQKLREQIGDGGVWENIQVKFAFFQKMGDVLLRRLGGIGRLSGSPILNWLEWIKGYNYGMVNMVSWGIVIFIIGIFLIDRWERKLEINQLLEQNQQMRLLVNSNTDTGQGNGNEMTMTKTVNQALVEDLDIDYVYGQLLNLEEWTKMVKTNLGGAIIVYRPYAAAENIEEQQFDETKIGIIENSGRREVIINWDHLKNNNAVRVNSI